MPRCPVASIAPSPEEILSFWLGDGSRPRDEWFRRTDAFDDGIRARFAGVVERAAKGELDAWRAHPRGRLALVILLDQFSRNIFRGTARSFAQDATALALALEGIAAGEDRGLSPLERSFLYMPLMHAEDRAMQERACAEFARLAAEAPPPLAGYLSVAAKFATAHRDIVERFGRFPHRNAVLGRCSTAEEAQFLREPGSAF
jgi:uncharacterized protein (DUF924 family)